MNFYKRGDILVRANQKFEYISTNPDGSLLVRPVGSLGMISIPNQGVAKQSNSSRVVIYSGKIRG